MCSQSGWARLFNNPYYEEQSMDSGFLASYERDSVSIGSSQYNLGVKQGGPQARGMVCMQPYRFEIYLHIKIQSEES